MVRAPPADHDVIGLGALLACHREGPARPPRDVGVGTRPTGDTGIDTVSTPDPPETAAHTGLPSGDPHTAGFLDTGRVPLRSDSGGPACVAPGPRPRAILTGGRPYGADCDVAEPVIVDPGPVVAADDLAVGRIDGDGAYGQCGFGLALVGDVDGDGVGEFVVGCEGLGEVWGFEGLPTGVVGRAAADAVVDTGVGGGWVLEVGDLLGPGRRALAVNDLLNTTIWVLELPLPPGLSAAASVAVGEIPRETMSNAAAGGVASVGDWDGDGQDDLGVSGVNPLLSGVEVGGGVNVLRGPFGGRTARALPYARMEVWATDMPWAIDTHHSGSLSVGLVADVTGDGRAEVLVGGDRNQNVAPPLLNPYDDDRLHGGLYLFDGGGVGDLAEADARAWLYGTCYMRLDGYMQRPVGDVTGDCQPDVAEGSVQFDLGLVQKRGAVLVLSELHRVTGRLRATRAAGAIIVGEQAWDELYSVGFAGDLDLDGYDELVVGARRAGAHRSGRVYVFRGPVSGVLSAADADLVLEGGPDDGVFGEPLRGGRDLDGDGVPDLLVGAYGSSRLAYGGGSVYAFSGADLAAYLR